MVSSGRYDPCNLLSVLYFPFSEATPLSKTLAQAETDQSSMMTEINRLRKHVHEVADHEEYLKRKNTELEEYGAYLEKRKNRLDALEIEKSDVSKPKPLTVRL